MNLLSFSKQHSFLSTSDPGVLPARRESLVQLNMTQTDAVFCGAVEERKTNLLLESHRRGS